MDELGQETRTRIAFATLAGVFGTIAVIAIAWQDWFGVVLFASMCSALMFMATSTRWRGTRAHR